jgi:hypothetical protein
MMAEIYRFGATDVTSFLTHLQVVDGNIAVAPLQQADYVVPGRTGAIAATPWWGPRVVTFGGVVAGASRSAYQTNVKGLARLVHNGGQPFTLQRTLDVPGTPSTQVTEATARYLGGLESVDEVSNRVGRVAFDVQLMDGYFYEGGTTLAGTVTGTATFTVAGDAPTQLVTLTYSVGAGSQRVSNAAFPGLGRLTLMPGSNTLTLTGGGSVVVSYRAAYL